MKKPPDMSRNRKNSGPILTLLGVRQILMDFVVVALALFFSFLLRFDLRIPPKYILLLKLSFPIVVSVNLVIYFASGLYNKWWRYTSVKDAMAVLRATILGSLVASIAIFLFIPHQRFPRSIIIIDWMLNFLFVAGLRFLARSLYQRPKMEASKKAKPVLVVGAGDAGELILKEMIRNPLLGHTPVALVDDDPRKMGISIHGVKVMGTTDELLDICEHFSVEEVIIAMPTSSGSTIKNIVYQCEKAGIVCKTLPGVFELIKGTVSVNQLRDVQVEDILGRDPVVVDVKEVSAYLKDKRVMVTGAGGSIGAELCRQISRLGPEELILVDNGENNLFSIEQELVGFGFENFSPFVADVKSRERMVRIFKQKRPEVVFHAAAYKHVPLMQFNPTEAINNNTVATKLLAEIAGDFEVERFVLISTDKAVKPTTLMGFSKALAERVIEAFSHTDGLTTKYMIVRFGNVLGSSGSVVPIFKKQIAEGGPVTVTHPEMTRFFMTIPEAVQLVIQAGAMGSGGEIFVLDMGKPVRIIDLAKNMIELSGHDPEKEIKIEFTGVRAGEKMHEELFNPNEEVGKTSHPKINLARRKPIDIETLMNDLEELQNKLYETDDQDLVQKMNWTLYGYLPGLGSSSFSLGVDEVAD